jgi:threonine dehydrogenase-like Zn-dependent dehydrogenase
MRATLWYGAGDVRVEEVPDPVLREPTDALVRVLAAGICEGELPLYGSMPATGQGTRVGHEFLGVVTDIGTDVSRLRVGDLVVAPFAWADYTCELCRDGLPTCCVTHAGTGQWGLWGRAGVDGGQGEAVRVPYAQGTLARLPVAADSALLPSLLTLSDVLSTGHYCAVKAQVGPRTSVAVIGDDAIGLLAVMTAKRRGAEQILVIGRNPERAGLARDFGATEVLIEPGVFDESAGPADGGLEGVERARAATGGRGPHVVLETFGSRRALETALAVVRDGGVISRTASRYTEVPIGRPLLLRNITLTGGAWPPRTYADKLLPDILDGTIEPGRVFDRTIGLTDVPDGYAAMATGEALKVLIRP